VRLLIAQADPAAGTAEFWVFVVVGAVALGSAIAMVLMRNAIHGALMLVVNFLAIAVLYAVLEAQFLAVIQVIVYAGAIMVLFLFIVMLLGVSRDEQRGGRLRVQQPVAVILGVLLFVGIAATTAAPFMGEASVCGVEAAPAAEGRPCQGLAEVNAEGNVRALGGPLFTTYVWPFEVVSILLVIAAIAAIVLGKRHDAPEDLVEPGDGESAPGAGAEAEQDALARREEGGP
jgi:NADH-quinone oxidoreductase subunit J